VRNCKHPLQGIQVLTDNSVLVYHAISEYPFVSVPIGRNALQNTYSRNPVFVVNKVGSWYT